MKVRKHGWTCMRLGCGGGCDEGQEARLDMHEIRMRRSM